MSTRMQQRRGTAQQWTDANPVLAEGEVGFETDTYQFKIGNGVNAWASLDYFSAGVDLSAYATEAYADQAEADAITSSNSYTDTAIANLVDSSPATLDTLNELAAALGDDANFATTVTNSLSEKAPLRQSFEDKSANYTFDAADTNKVIRNTSGTPVTFTIPVDTFTLGDRVDIINGATGVITFAAASGVTLLSKDGAVTIDTQHAAATLLFRDTNLVYLIGDIA